MLGLSSTRKADDNRIHSKKMRLLSPGLSKPNRHEDCKPVKLNRLINSINRIHFHGGSILVRFKHSQYDQTVVLNAHPRACYDNRLECTWENTHDPRLELRGYDFLDFSISDGLSQIMVDADMNSISHDGICMILPEKCYEGQQRKVKRNPCQGIELDLYQDGTSYQGTLQDFSAISFCVEVSEAQSYDQINLSREVHAIIKTQGKIYYSGSCKIIRNNKKSKNSTLVLQPIQNQVNRFRPKEIRCTRQELIPSPNIVFKHPFTGKKVSLKVKDLSGSGVSVEESPDNRVLLPGLMIHELGIELMNSVILKCEAQVIYNRPIDDTTVKIGLAILDMSAQDHITLSNVLYRAEDNNSYIGSSNLDMDALWDFFFETGFVYPKKYALVETEQEAFRKLYTKLYMHCPDIARHIIYQEKGKIFGHVSMLRTYEKTWMIHHHAALTTKHNSAGLVAMQQIGRYANDYHNLRSSNMDYIVCYFRPENRFPNKAFGDVARNAKDSKVSSLDTFSCYKFKKNTNTEKIVAPWSLELASPTDLEELRNYYEHNSAGLTLHALDLTPETNNNESNIDKEYNKIGFKRDFLIYALKENGILQAIFVVNATQSGLNMSDLTNCVHAFVLEPDNLKRDKFDTALNELIHHFGSQKNLSTLIFPSTYVEKQNMSCEKKYHLWIMNLEHIDFYFKHVENLLHRNRRNTQERRITFRRAEESAVKEQSLS